MGGRPRHTGGNAARQISPFCVLLNWRSLRGTATAQIGSRVLAVTSDPDTVGLQMLKSTSDLIAEYSLRASGAASNAQKSQFGVRLSHQALRVLPED
jgi:hypothetical protein